MHSAVRYLAVPLAIVAVVAAALAGSARRAGARVDERQVDVGGSATLVEDPSSAEPFEPFRFAVIGPVRGDHGALDRALERIDERGGAALVILSGDVTRAGNEGELRALSAVLQDADRATIVLPGDADRRSERMESVQRRLGPNRWMFVRNDCRFVGVSGSDAGADAADRTFVSEQTRPVKGLVHTFQVRVHGEPGGDLLTTADALERLGQDAGGALALALYSVTRDGIDVEHDTVRRGPTLSALRRDLELGVLYPALSGHWAFGGFLLLCFAALGGAWRLWRTPGPRYVA